jgi:hypothetical protein
MRLAAMAIVAALLFAIPPGATAKDCPYTPAAGSAERKAIMDTLRQPVMRELNQPVVFLAEQFAVCRGWAFLEVEPQRPGGTPIDWSVSPYAEAMAEGMCGGYVHALLMKEGSRWRIRVHEICGPMCLG